MRILQLLIHPDVLAGTERTTHIGTEALRAAGDKVFLLHDQTDTPRTAELYDGSLGLPLIFDERSKLPPGGLRDAESRLDEFIRANKIDLIHVHSYPRIAAYAKFVRKYCTVTGVHVAMCPNGARYFWKDRRPCDRKIGLGCLTTGYCRKGCGHLGNGVPVSPQAFVRMMVTDHLQRRAIAHSVRIIAISTWLQDQLIADGFSPEIISVVRSPLEDFPEAAEWVAPELPPVILFVGRLVDIKAPDHLLEASARISIPHRVWIVGDGPLRTRLEQMSQSLGIADRVTFYGDLPPIEVAKLRFRSTVAVVPSVCPEVFGRVGPESLLTRRPVVAYKVGGIPEWLTDHITGRLVPVGDVESLARAVQEIVKDPELARRMGDRGAQDAVKWTRLDHGVQLRAVYEKALGSWQHMSAGGGERKFVSEAPSEGLRILQLLIHPDVLAGTERTTHIGTEALRAAGDKVFLLHDQTDTPRTAELYDGSLGLPLIFDERSKLPPRGFRDAESRLDEFIRANKIDLIHVHSYPRIAAYAKFVRKYCTVTGVHVAMCPNGARYFWKDRRPCDRKIGLGCLTTGYCRKGCGHLGNGVPVSPQAFVRMMVTDRLLHRVAARSAHVIGVSAWIRDQLIADGFQPEHVSVLRSPMENPPEAADWVPPEEPPVVLFVGRLVDVKAPDHVLQASARISVPHRVWIVGDGPMRAPLEAFVRSLGIEERVTFYGDLKPSEVVKLRLRSTVAVVPSVWPEVFGRVGPESFLARRPVVAYRVGGIPEWLTDGETGRLVSVGDIESLANAIREILSNPQLARTMGENGVRYATSLIATNHGSQLREIYKKALAAWNARCST